MRERLRILDSPFQRQRVVLLTDIDGSLKVAEELFMAGVRVVKLVERMQLEPAVKLLVRYFP